MSQRTVLVAFVGVLVLCVCLARAEIFFHDEFNSLDGWVQSEHKSDYGKVKLSAGAVHVDAKKEQGLQLSEDAKFYAVSKKLPTPVNNDGKNLVISFSVKHDQKLECGGAYLKFFSELDQKDFNGESPYWDIVAPETIPDPDEKKPEDWVDDQMMDDPADTKPADWDDEPATIADPNATKPEDWDDEEDGEWNAPMIPNPAYRGEWSPRQIANPAYKGVWAPKQIPNPNYKPEPNLYRVPAPLQYIGIDVWQVQGGSIFDNIILGDDLQEVLKLVKSTYGAMAEKEKKLLKVIEKEKREEASKAKAEAEKAAAAEEAASEEEEEKEDEDDL